MTIRRFEGKVALVTGAALGMGRTTARRFAAEGAKVCVVDILKTGVEETAAMICAEGGEAFACVADISQEADNERMVDETIARYGGLDAVDLNAALLGEHAPFFESTVAHYDRIVSVNQRGCFLGMRAVGRVMRPGGAVVVMSSTAGILGHPINPAYSASKHAVIGLVRSAAPAFGERGLRINVVCPGGVNTRMHTSDPVDDPIVPLEDLPPVDFRGVATPQHIAELVLFLCSSGAGFITGAVHTIDGGGSCAFNIPLR
ncbi:MAG: short-chain dehydrogenase/reductase [Rhodospirillales bacterium]|nr:short-chain dehydrogenase/reductase [Rhodospirillales bacterium]